MCPSSLAKSFCIYSLSLSFFEIEKEREREREREFVVLICTMIALVAPKLLRENERMRERREIKERCERLKEKKKAQVIYLFKIKAFMED
jgi:hypothetical protein